MSWRILIFVIFINRDGMWQKTSRFNSQRGTLLICIILIDIKNTINSYRNNDSPNSRASQVEKASNIDTFRDNSHLSWINGHFGKQWRLIWVLITVILVIHFLWGHVWMSKQLVYPLVCSKWPLPKIWVITVVLVWKKRSFWTTVILDNGHFGGL